MKRPLVIANWKMSPSRAKEAQRLFDEINKGIEHIKNAEVVVCPPFPYISMFHASRFRFQVGAQDCFWEDKGPYTGEVSPSMLKSLGCTHVILGHSERKQLGETREMVNKKIKAALAAGLIPIVCIGENLEKELKVVLREIISLREMSRRDKNLILVYEPAWAISTSNGKAATPQHVREAAVFMRKFLPVEIPILYGGSVESSTIKSFLGPELAQGALVGGASLEAKEFIALVKNAALV